MQVFIFHLMPYTHMDLNYEKKWRSSWVVMPTGHPPVWQWWQYPAFVPRRS